MSWLKDMDQNTWEAMYEVVPAPLSEASSCTFAVLEKNIYVHNVCIHTTLFFYVPYNNDLCSNIVTSCSLKNVHWYQEEINEDASYIYILQLTILKTNCQEGMNMLF